MDIASVLGLSLAYILVLMGVVLDINTMSLDFTKLKYFFDIPSILIVFGGTAASILSSYPMGKVMRMGKIFGKFLKQQQEELIETLTLIIDVSRIARKNILAIEDALPSIDNTFLRNGLRLVVDRVDRELIMEILHSEMKYTAIRKDEDIAIMGTAGALAPAFGMIGTLIGLILMLQNLDDPSTIGPSMAVAIITTLYGSLLANTVFVPAQSKLNSKKKDEQILSEMVRDGILYIEKGERPDFIEQDLLNYLSPDQKAMYEEMKFESSSKGGGD